MNVLKIQNDYSWLITDDEILKTTLWKALRKREKGYFHSPLFKKGVWDGYSEFFKLKTGRFLTGLLPEIMAALKKRESEVHIDDQRGRVNFVADSIDENFIKDSNGHVLRDYQVDLINRTIKYKRGIVFAPTSAGKTDIMIGILKAIQPGTPILFLANRKGLVDQNYREIKACGFDRVGRLYANFAEPDLITCATVQSLHKIEKQLPKFEVLVVDEIHDMMSKVPKKFYNKMKSASVRVAVSATPFKFGGKDKCQMYNVKGHFGPVFKTEAGNEKGVLTTKTLQDRDILSASDCTFFHINEPKIPYELYLDAVTKGIAENVVFHKMVKKLTSSLKGRTLILVDRIAHGDALKHLIPKAIWISGKDTLETRQHVVDQLKNCKGKVVGIATQQIFNTGINVLIHNLINAAGGQAEHQIIQRMGRGLRTADDKEDLKYYDFIFNINDYLLKHSNKRIKILKDEGHNIEIKEEFKL